MRRACILTLGCPKNQADSEVFAGCLRAAGWRPGSDPEDADLILLNTCAFIRPAVDESLEVMEQAEAWKRERDDRILVLAGCLPGRYADDGSGGLENYDLVIGPADWKALSVFLGIDGHDRIKPSGAGTYRYLKISEGCSNNCSYCTIPLIRGPRRDRTISSILGDARDLALQGAREIGIVGQDTASWREGERGIRYLLESLAGEHPEIWFRLYYMHPAHPVEDLPKLLMDYPNIMPYIDMPIQHVSDKLLGRMGRGYSRRDLQELFESYDDLQASVRVTVITGYPGESDSDFSMLEEFLICHRSIRTIAAFPWWPEEGTVEYDRYLESELPSRETIQYRLSRIGDVADGHYHEWGDRLEGSIIEIMADSAELGHSMFDAPEVDGACLFNRRVSPGSIMSCMVAGYDGPDLLVEVIT